MATTNLNAICFSMNYLHGVLKSSLRQADGLKSDSNASFIQQPNGDLVTVSHSTQNSIRPDNAVSERNLASAAGAYSQFVLVASNVQARVGGLHHEGSDSFVPAGDKAVNS